MLYAFRVFLALLAIAGPVVHRRRVEGDVVLGFKLSGVLRCFSSEKRKPFKQTASDVAGFWPLMYLLGLLYVHKKLTCLFVLLNVLEVTYTDAKQQQTY